MTQFTYRTNHLPTGLITETDVECSSKEAFLYLLNRWNTEGRDEYIYTAAKGQNFGVFDHTYAMGAHDFKNTRTVQKVIRTPKQINKNGGYWTSNHP